MTGWRYYPLAEFPRTGLLVSPDRVPHPASFLTLDQAKADAEKRRLRGAAA
jgi:hypothetical protein